MKLNEGIDKREFADILRERYGKEIAHMLRVSFAGIAAGLMIVSAGVVVLILSILMASTIRKQYREIGIMKGMGYTSRELTFQMAFRIVPVVLLGVIAGTVLSLLLMGIVNAYVAKITITDHVDVDAFFYGWCYEHKTIGSICR